MNYDLKADDAMYSEGSDEANKDFKIDRCNLVRFDRYCLTGESMGDFVRV